MVQVSGSPNDPNPFPIPFPENYEKIQQGFVRLFACLVCHTALLTAILQSRQEIPGTRRPGQTGVYRNTVFPDVITVDSQPNWPKTSYDSFNFGLARAKDKPCFGKRPWNRAVGDFERTFVWETYGESERLGLVCMLFVRGGLCDVNAANQHTATCIRPRHGFSSGEYETRVMD